MCLSGDLDVNMCVLSASVYSTSLKGTDNAHVFSAQIQEGVCVWRQLHQLHCWVLEHQVFGRCIGFRGEEVKVLKKKKKKTKSSKNKIAKCSYVSTSYIVSHCIASSSLTGSQFDYWLFVQYILVFYTFTEVMVVQINSASCGSLRLTTAWAGTLARWQVL